MTVRLALLALLVPSAVLADTMSSRTSDAELVRAMKRHDAKTIAARLATPLEYKGVWFADAGCAKRFSRAGVLQTKDREVFARCFAKLVPQLSTRVSTSRESTVITVEPGIELELTFDAEGNIRRINPAGGSDTQGTPMLTAQAFEALRTTGTTLLDDKVRELDNELTKANPTSAWIRTCVAETGLSTRETAWSSTPMTGELFLRATSDWTFRAYTPPKQKRPVRVCSLSLLTYPASRAPSIETLPKGSGARVEYDFEDDLDFGTNLAPLPAIATLQPHELAALSLVPLDPKPATAVQLTHTPRDRLSSINVCLGTQGTVRNVVTLDQQPGDRIRAGKIWRWKFKPYVVNGVATEACALLKFIVTP